MEPRFLPPLEVSLRGAFSFERVSDYMFKTLKEDIAIIKERDPAARSSLEIWLTYSGLHAIRAYRVAHWFHKKGLLMIARIISQRARNKTGIEIHPGAKIGKGLFIDHGMSVVIGETTEIGDYCLLYQGVTLGGTGKDQGKRHPTLGNNVLVGSGAKVLGPFKVGDNARIAANAVVLKEVPPNSTAVGVPARIVRKDGAKTDDANQSKDQKDFCCPQDLDQIHIPDPVSQELCRLKKHLQKLESQVEGLLKDSEVNGKEHQ